MPLRPANTGTRDDYEVLCAAMLHLAGIDLHEYKRQQMERRIRSFAQRRGCVDLVSYAKLLRRDGDELHSLLQRMTINVSQLFRNPQLWKVLGDIVLPELATRGRIDAWSAGCSYGAEAYSLAALAAERTPGTRLSIRASDIDDVILAACARGEFSDADARTAPTDMLERWFDRSEHGWVAARQLRDRITPVRENLLTIAPRSSFDLVLCRNVVIYFEVEARMRVHAMLADSLRPGGFLAIGSTERITQPLAQLGLEKVHPLVYRRR